MWSPSEISPASPQSREELPSQRQEGNQNGPSNTQFQHDISGSTTQPVPTWEPFSIVTENKSLSSGFPYTSRLRELRVTPDQWLQFTTEVLEAAKLSFKEDAAAWTAGVTTGTLTMPLLLVFGPWAGYHAGKSVHRKAVAKKVKKLLVTEGPLRSTLRQWNEGVFLGLGIQFWLDPPNTNDEVIVDAPADATPKERQTAKKKQAKKFRFVCMPYDPRNAPIGTDHNPTAPMNSQSSWSVNQSPVSMKPTMYVNSEGKWDAKSPLTDPVEISAVRPVMELPSGDKEIHDKDVYEMDGSRPEVVKE